MANQRWIVRFLGDAASISKTKLNTLLRDHSINVVDKSLFPKFLLVEGSEEKINQLKMHFDLTFTPEKSYKIPDARKKIQH